MPIKLRMKTMIPSLFFVMGLGQLMLGTIRANRGSDPNAQFLLGFLALLLAGFMYWFCIARPYGTIDQASATLISPFGLFNRTYQYQSLHDVKVVGNQIQLKTAAGLKTFPLTKQIVNSSDWSNLESVLAQYQTGKQ